MPQMAPISWLTLFVLFSFTFIIFNILNYYNFFLLKSSNSSKLENNKKILKSNFLNWKW